MHAARCCTRGRTCTPAPPTHTHTHTHTHTESHAHPHTYTHTHTHTHTHARTHPCEDAAKCEAVIERRSRNTTTSGREWEYVNRRQLQQAPYWYSAEEAEKIVQEQEAKGRSMPDANFPGDKSKTLVLVRARTSYATSSAFEETLGAEARVQMDSEMAQALLGADGILTPSGCPDVYGLSESAMAAFAVENVHGTQHGTLPKPKPKAKPKPTPGAPPPKPAAAGVVEPQQVLAHAKAMQVEFLDEVCV